MSDLVRLLLIIGLALLFLWFAYMVLFWWRKDARSRGEALEFNSSSASKKAAVVPASTPKKKTAAKKASTAPAKKKKAAAAKKPSGPAKQDLTKIEGIGPAIEKLLNGSGIKNFLQLSDSTLPTLRKILADGGSRFTLHDPKSWPRQAHLAAKGDWEKLAALQDTLKGGK